MLKELNEKQTAALETYKNKWLNIGLDTKQSDAEDYKECFEAVKQIMAGEHDSLQDYVVCQSPQDIYNRVQDRTTVFNAVYGSFESPWLSFYDFFINETDVEVDKKLLEPFFTLALHVSWCCIKDNTVYFSVKPSSIVMNEDNLLHNDNGPSVEFPDGFKVWSLEGHRVNEKIVMNPESLTIKEIHNQENADIQAIMIDRFGWERYIKESNATLIDSRENDIENTLEALYETEKFGRRLVCTCPTGRVFVKGIQTLDKTQTCEGAQNWLSGYGNNRKFVTVGRT